MNYLLIFTVLFCFNSSCMELKKLSNQVYKEEQKLYQFAQLIEICKKEFDQKVERLEREIKTLEQVRMQQNFDPSFDKQCKTKIAGYKNLLQSVRTIRNDMQ